MKELDNIKMWETILYELPESELTDAIVSALEKQGFRHDGEHIVPKEHENNNVTMEYDIKTGALTLKNLSHAEAKALEIIYGAKRKSESRLPSFEESQGEQPTTIFYGLTNCTSEEKSELTEFEKLIQQLLIINRKYDGFDDNTFIKAWASKIRKQIASEIDDSEDIQKMSAMFQDEYQSMFIGYVDDIIKKIKEG